MPVNSCVIVRRQITSKVAPDDFELSTVPLSEPQSGEVLVRTAYLSIDAYMLTMLKGENPSQKILPGEPMKGRVIGEVVQSRHARWKPKDRILGVLDWSHFVTAKGDTLTELVDDGLPLTAHLGVLGSPGVTAWAGMVDIAGARQNEIVVVSAAAGAIGSIAGQIAKIKGCTVVGIAGGREKCRYVTDILGFDACVDYRASTFARDLAAVLPDGADVYLENVGGVVLDAVLPCLKHHARIAVCGLIAHYSDQPVSLRHLVEIRRRRLNVRGFAVVDYLDRSEPIIAELRGWMKSGKLRNHETVAKGLAAAPGALVGLFEGANIGKQIVAVEAA